MSQEEQNKQKKPADDNFVEVAVVTTSGSYPDEGFERTPVHQKVSVILKKAVHELGIADTNDWVATVGDRELDVNANHEQLVLSGNVEIDYGPREGGGGNA